MGMAVALIVIIWLSKDEIIPVRQIDCGFSLPIRLLVNFGQAESWCQTNMLFKIGFYLPGLWYNMFWPARSWSNVQYTYDYIYMYTKEFSFLR